MNPYFVVRLIFAIGASGGPDIGGENASGGARGRAKKSQKIPIIVAGKKIIPIFALPDFGTKQLTIA